MFSYELCKISKSTFLKKHLRKTDSKFAKDKKRRKSWKEKRTLLKKSQGTTNRLVCNVDTIFEKYLRKRLFLGKLSVVNLHLY